MSETTSPTPDAPPAPHPLRETKVLHRYVQGGVYGILLAFLPIQLWIIGMPLEYALASDTYFFGLATLAIEGAFKNGRLIRKRVAYPTSILAEMRQAESSAEAARQAARRTTELLQVEIAAVLVGEGEESLFTDADSLIEATAILQSFRPTIEAARQSGDISRVSYRNGEIVIVPLLGAHGEIGALVLYATRQADASDSQLLQNIGSRVGIFLEAHWQREELKRKEAHSKAMLDAIPDVILRIKSDGTITYYVFRRDQQDRLISVENPVGQSLYPFLPESLARKVREALRRALTTGELQRMEYDFQTPAGTAYREARIVPVADDEVLAIVRDVSDTRAAEVALRQREEYFRQLIENAQDAIVVVATNGTVKYASPALGRMLGFDQNELVGVDALQLVEPEDREKLVEVFAAQFQGGDERSGTAEFHARHKDGSIRIIEATARPLTPHAAETEIVINGRDVTERQEAAAILRESEERMRTIFEEAPIGMSIVQPDFTVLSVNKALCEMLGYDEDTLRRRGLAGVTHPDDLGEDLEMARELAEGRADSYRLEKRFITRDGEIVWGDTTATVIRDRDGNALYGLGMIENITDRKKAEETVRHLAFHDHLTGLPNRALFRDRLELALAQARRGRQMAAVIFLDLDRFKMVNDSVGHAAGDQLLCQVAEKISRIVREGDTVSRVGGDEFTVLLPTIEKVQDAVRIATRILEGLSHPFTQDGKEFIVSGSIGITIIPDDGDDVDTLLRNADIAMYRAKELGRNQYQLYAPHMNHEILERIAFEAELRHAVERGELEVHYQPQFDVKTMAVTGVEALARWRRQDGTYVPPSEFIPVAEETGLITQLGHWVLREACTQAVEWQNIGLPPVRVNVNVSAREFQGTDLIERVEAVLAETGLDASCLQIEITEGVAMEEVDSSLSTLRQLKAMGVQLALDDFGVGYSSLAYLKRFPIDTLKIDCSFIRNVGAVAADTALVGAIITMAHSLGLRVIAEGVEKPEQLDFLRDPQVEGIGTMACDEFQGFLASRPVAPQELEDLLRAGKGTTEARPAA
ncbi:MAG TPA: EAL domain-containing protein [Dehalococcoidia bacterium]|nr:EAL domain-containing protein [Dehalococcoidia bacterium]